MLPFLGRLFFLECLFINLFKIQIIYLKKLITYIIKDLTINITN